MSIREVSAALITDTIERMCIEANEYLPEDVKCALARFYNEEDGAVARSVLKNIIDNYGKTTLKYQSR